VPGALRVLIRVKSDLLPLVWSSTALAWKVPLRGSVLLAVQAFPPPDVVVENGDSKPLSNPSKKVAPAALTSSAALGAELLIPMYLLVVSVESMAVPAAFCTLKPAAESV
jgi:hypothetical protein